MPAVPIAPLITDHCKFIADVEPYFYFILKRLHLIFYIITIESTLFQPISKFLRYLLGTGIMFLISAPLVPGWGRGNVPSCLMHSTP